MSFIQKVFAREILDSRGNPTIECAVVLSDGIIGIASCPSGASTGTHEAVELRDNDKNHYMGKGVQKAIANIKEIIAPKIIGQDAANQENIDKIMIGLDGTENKGKLGANAILSVSMAVARAQAASEKTTLYTYIQKLSQNTTQLRIPTPLFNIVNGGKHAGENIDFQEFIIIPNLLWQFSDALEKSVCVYIKLKQTLVANGMPSLVGDEGGFGPTLPENVAALVLIKQAIEESGFALDKDMFLGMDVAASTFYKNGKYTLKENPNGISGEELINLYRMYNNIYHFLYLEDILAEDDWDNWTKAVQAFQGTQALIVGDDLLVTNPKRLQIGIDKKAITGILIKLNQIGTVTETLAVIKQAKQANIKTIVSHRSGETNDDFIADFAVGVGADFVKFGAPARGERVAKYNRLLQIEQEIINRKS